MRRFSYLTIPLVLMLLVWLHLQQVRNSSEQQYLDQQTALQALAFKASLERYRLGMELFFSQTIDRPEVKRLFSEALESEGSSREQLRERLYNELKPSYDKLQALGVRQWQFHTPDGYSFLRFHDPELLGDDLLPYRPSLKRLMADPKPLNVFEPGRIFIGFRHIRPLFDQGRLIGSTETAVSFRHLRDALRLMDSLRYYQFLLRREPIEAVTLDVYREHHRLSESSIDPGFLILDDDPEEVASLDGVAIGLLEQRVREQPELKTKIASGTPFTLGFEADRRYFAVTFTPVPDIEGGLAAYLLAFSPAPILATIHHDYYKQLVIILSMLVLVGVLLFKVMSHHAALRRQSQQMDAIASAVGEGVFVIDASGQTLYVNEATCELTGFPRQELMSSDIHSLLHSHEPDDRVNCSILTTIRTGQPYNGDERFRRRDGSFMPVAVTSRAMRERDTITGVVTVFRDITERKEWEDKLAHQANVDELTGLLNRRALVQLISREMARLNRTAKGSALMMIDFDHFKAINDHHGHDAGDEVLRHFAELAVTCLREIDSLGRLGGEEFAVLLPETDLEGARVLAERLRTTIEQSPTQVGGVSIPLTLSIGITELSASDRKVTDLLRRVDRALYAAKHLGRNRVELV